MKTLFKFPVIFAGLALLLAACDIQQDSGNIFDIRGTYTFTENSYSHTLVFEGDDEFNNGYGKSGTYQFTSGSGSSSQNKSGTWSISFSIHRGSIYNYSLNMRDTASPVNSSMERFSVSSKGNSYTITLRDGSPVSVVLSTFSVAGNTLTITKADSNFRHREPEPDTGL